MLRFQFSTHIPGMVKNFKKSATSTIHGKLINGSCGKQNAAHEIIQRIEKPL